MFMAGPFPLEGEAAGATVAPAGAGAGTPWSVHVRGSVQFDPDVLDPLVHDADPGGGVVAEHVECSGHTGLIGRPPFGECLVQTRLGILADVPG